MRLIRGEDKTQRWFGTLRKVEVRRCKSRTVIITDSAARSRSIPLFVGFAG